VTPTRAGATRRALAGSLALLTVVACSGGSTEKSGPTTTRAPDSTTTTAVPGAPREYAANPGDWVLPGRDYDNSRTATGSTIDASNVGRLTEAWSVPVTGSLTTVPLIVGDTIYVQDGAGVIYAIDRAAGSVRWKTEAYGFNIGPYGVAVADGRVFGAHGIAGIVAVDARTGKELWTRDLQTTTTTGLDIQPTVYAGTVLAATVPVSTTGIYTPGDRGILYALDAATGKTRWRFDTVKGDLWGHPEVNSGGGAWYPPSIDPVRGLVYWGVANPAPFPGTKEYPNGTSRPGPNLYTDSTVALDVATGKLRWFHQVHPHDNFDRDLVHTLIARARDGREVVIGTGKGAVVVGLDPESGERRWSTPVGLHRNDDLETLSGPTEVAPGTFGGVITPPATADGVVFLATVNAPATLMPDETAYFATEMGQQDGEVVALDATTGEVVWDTKVPGDPLGAATVVNDLVLTSLLDGTLVALDRATGTIVWQTKAPGGINGWMAVAGDLLVVPVGNGSPPSLVAYEPR
jgi:outer membrane protein assembly factor BamB